MLRSRLELMLPTSTPQYQLSALPAVHRRGEPAESFLIQLPLGLRRSIADQCGPQFSLLSEKDLIPLEDFNKTILEETTGK